MKKALDNIFIGMILLIIFAGFGRTLLAPDDVNTYENRYAEKPGRFSVQSYLSGEFQDQLELAASDQLPLSETAKRKYNSVISGFTNSIVKRMISDSSEAPLTVEERIISDENLGGDRADQPEDAQMQAYIKLGSNLYLCGNHLMAGFRPLSGEKENADTGISAINAAISEFPDTEFYLYYVKRDVDFDFSTGEKSGTDEYILQNVNVPEERKGTNDVEDYAEFDYMYFRTDHHWNYFGSYQGYKQILSMLLPEETPLAPAELLKIGEFSGSRAAGAGISGFTEDFFAYNFDFPELKIVINNEPADNYGNQEGYIAAAKGNGGTCGNLSYGNFYGWDNGETVFENPASDNGNILVLGDSNDNAVIKLLASHFSKLFAVDLRNYEAQKNEEFVLSDYIEKNNIKTILIDGTMDFYVIEDFRLSNYM